MKTLLIILVTSNFALAQYWGGQEIKTSNLSNWIPKFILEYAGTYHFGESESESDFHLFFSGDCILGQVKSGYWDRTGVWKSNYVTLTNISIDKKGRFLSDQYSGQFIRYRTESGHLIKGLMIDNPWTAWIEDGEFEIGTRTKIIFQDIYPGKYFEASSRKLMREELRIISLENLRLMRNEIFARYGYTFKKKWSNG